jgi:hypothetical protein
MSKFKPGDRVRIRDYMRLREEYGYIEDDELIPMPWEPFTDDMQHWCGKIVTIKEIFYPAIHDRIPCYIMEEDIEDLYMFTEEMFELVIDTEAFPKYRTNRDYYLSLDEFDRVVYITNFIRFHVPQNLDVYSRVGQEKAKKAFEDHLKLPYIEPELVESIIRGSDA